jgi:molecular chaperone DnaJ
VEQDIESAFAELGLAADATELEVKAAWRRLVSQWHPDRNGSATALAKMQRINRAIEAIRQAGFRGPGPARRAGGAKTGQPGPRRRGKGERSGPRFDYTRKAASSKPDDDRAATPKPSGPPTRTISRRIRLTLEEAAFGCIKVLRGKVTEICSACAGVGYRVLGGHCPRCHGSGAVHERSWFGWVGVPTECDACHGGSLARQRCAACAGTGKAAAQRYKVTVRFPHGARDGDLLSVEGGQGKPGSPPGGLSIRVEVLEHALFELDNDGTVRCDMPVDGFAWIANRATLGGPRTIQLQRDQLSYRLKGQGFPVERRGPRGDQMVTVSPIFPQRMTTDQQILLDQLIATTSGPDAKESDERLRRWNQAVRTWKQGERGRD